MRDQKNKRGEQPTGNGFQFTLTIANRPAKPGKTDLRPSPIRSQPAFRVRKEPLRRMSSPDPPSSARPRRMSRLADQQPRYSHSIISCGPKQLNFRRNFLAARPNTVNGSVRNLRF